MSGWHPGGDNFLLFTNQLVDRIVEQLLYSLVENTVTARAEPYHIFGRVREGLGAFGPSVGEELGAFMSIWEGFEGFRIWES